MASYRKAKNDMAKVNKKSGASHKMKMGMMHGDSDMMKHKKKMVRMMGEMH